MKDKKERELSLAKEAAKWLMPLFENYYRARYVGLENIPDKPFLGVGNHLGVYFMPETYLWMGKYHTMNFDTPMKVLVHHALHKALSFFKFPEKEFGILNANMKNAINALRGGSAITVYPGGDRENSKPYNERHKIDFYNHYGYIELALKAGVPILPVVGVGGGETLFVLSSGEKIAEITGLKNWLKVHTWPVYWSFPFGWHVGHFPFLSIPLPSQITISVLPPYSLEKYKPEDANKPEVLKEINDNITQKMQIEMNKLAKDRIPVIG